MRVAYLTGVRGQVYHEMMLVTMEEYDKKERDAEASVKQRYKDVARSVVTHALHWKCRHNAMHAETGVSKRIEHGSLET